MLHTFKNRLEGLACTFYCKGFMKHRLFLSLFKTKRCSWGSDVDGECGTVGVVGKRVTL